MSAANDGAAAPDTEIWADDLLGRRDFADFLTRTLVARTRTAAEKQVERGWAVSLDATWGAGKSFFVERWVRTLREQRHPVVYFDAWENDLGEEASIALMAEVNDELEKWIDALPKREILESAARALTTRAKQKLRRSVMPVAKVVGSALLKKALGAGIDEFAEALGPGQPASEGGTAALKATADNVLDKVFEVSLEEHRRRKSNIRDFKKSMVDLIDLIEREADARVPVFVFVDELDRCRPTYAITLLEEMKHIFGMEKVCFVVSTNLSQLKHSIGAVYGSDFNSEMYLKRFFDQSVGLPQASREHHIDALVADFDAICRKPNATGLPSYETEDAKKEEIGVIFHSFGLDPRSRRQIFQIADCVVSSIENHPVHMLYLFFLCALFHEDQSMFDGLEGGKSKASEVFEKMGIRNPAVKIDVPNYNTGQIDVRNESLASVLDEYLVLSRLEAFDLYKKVPRFRLPFEYLHDQLREEVPRASREAFSIRDISSW